MVLRYIAFAASIYCCSIFSMDMLYTASIDNNSGTIARFAEFVDVNTVLEDACKTQLIHKVMQSVVTLKFPTLIMLIKLGINLNVKAKKRLDGDLQTPLEMAIDACAMIADGFKIKAHILTQLYLYGALPNRRSLNLDQLNISLSHLDIRLIALLGSLEQFKEACLCRNINRANAQQELEKPAPQNLPPHSLLYLAALSARTETISYLIETMGLDVNVLSPHNGLPPLYAARKRADNIESVTKLLLRHGANTGTYTEKRAWTASIRSKAYESYKPVKFIVKKSSNGIMSAYFDCLSNTMVLSVE